MLTTTCKVYLNQQGNFDGTFKIDRGDGEDFRLKVNAPSMTLDEAPCGEVDLKLAVYDREGDSIEKPVSKDGIGL